MKLTEFAILSATRALLHRYLAILYLFLGRRFAGYGLRCLKPFPVNAPYWPCVPRLVMNISAVLFVCG